MIRGIFFSQAFVENLISSWKWTYSLMWISSDSRLVESSFLAVSVTLCNEYFIYPWVWWSFKVYVYDTTEKEKLLVKTNLMSHIATFDPYESTFFKSPICLLMSLLDNFIGSMYIQSSQIVNINLKYTVKIMKAFIRNDSTTLECFSCWGSIWISDAGHQWICGGTCGKWWSGVSMDWQDPHTSRIQWSSAETLLQIIRCVFRHIYCVSIYTCLLWYQHYLLNTSFPEFVVGSIK